MKRTPLKSNKPLSRGSSTLKRTPLKYRSDKTQKLYQEKRIPFVIYLLDKYPKCQICLTRKSIDIHEVQSRGRTGGVNSQEWLEEDNCLAICRVCHNKIGEMPKWAEEMGYLKKSSY